MPTRYASVCNLPSTVDNVVAAGENTLVSLYGGKPGEKLDGMRYQGYCEKMTTNNSQIQPQNLSSTSAAGRYHSPRVYLQVKQWKCENEGMSLEGWGWNVANAEVLPVQILPTSLTTMTANMSKRTRVPRK